MKSDILCDHNKSITCSTLSETDRESIICEGNLNSLNSKTEQPMVKKIHLN